MRLIDFLRTLDTNYIEADQLRIQVSVITPNGEQIDSDLFEEGPYLAVRSAIISFGQRELLSWTLGTHTNDYGTYPILFLELIYGGNG